MIQVDEWPPFGKKLLIRSTVFSHCIILNSNFSCFPFGFRGQDVGLDCTYPGHCLLFCLFAILGISYFGFEGRILVLVLPVLGHFRKEYRRIELSYILNILYAGSVCYYLGLGNPVYIFNKFIISYLYVLGASLCLLPEKFNSLVRLSASRLILHLHIDLCLVIFNSFPAI